MQNSDPPGHWLSNFDENAPISPSPQPLPPPRVSPPIASAPPNLPPRPSEGNSPPGAADTELAAPAAASVPQRDRLVILGRRRAGKTIYLARLYEMCWNGKFPGLHMRAVAGPGNGHERFMETIASLKVGRWPAATASASSTEVVVEYEGHAHRMVALDYAGEVFRAAFVKASEQDDAIELRDHVDRAAGVIILLDPEVAVEGTISESMDDDYGMSEAIRTIRESPGGAVIPIAMVLTKCDVHQALVKEAGGLRAFTDRYYFNIMRTARGTTKRFAAAAVRVRRDALGRDVPSIQSEPINVVEPLKYCLEKMISRSRVEQELEAKAMASRRLMELERLEEEVARKQSLNATIWAVGVVGCFVILLVTLFFLNKYSII